jgi:hypothetical protein
MTRPMGKRYRDAEHRERIESLPTQVIPSLERGAPGATPETHESSHEAGFCGKRHPREVGLPSILMHFSFVDAMPVRFTRW